MAQMTRPSGSPIYFNEKPDLCFEDHEETANQVIEGAEYAYTVSDTWRQYRRPNSKLT